MKIGVIGVGNWGLNHVRTLLELGHSVYIEDASGTREDWVLGNYKVKRIIDYRNTLDGIIVATPSDEHYKVVQKWLRQRVHVLCEKPLCLTNKDTRSLVQLARSKEVILAENFLLRYTTPAKLFRKLIHVYNPKRIVMSNYVTTGPRHDCNIVFDLGSHMVDLLEFAGLMYYKLVDYHVSKNSISLSIQHGGTEILVNLGYHAKVRQRDIFLRTAESSVCLNFLDIRNTPLTDSLVDFCFSISRSLRPIHPTYDVSSAINVIKLLEEVDI